MEESKVLLRRKADQFLSDLISYNILLDQNVPEDIKSKGLELLLDSAKKVINPIPDNILYIEDEIKKTSNTPTREALTNETKNEFRNFSEPYIDLSRMVTDYNINYYLSNLSVKSSS